MLSQRAARPKFTVACSGLGRWQSPPKLSRASAANTYDLTSRPELAATVQLPCRACNSLCGVITSGGGFIDTVAHSTEARITVRHHRADVPGWRRYNRESDRRSGGTAAPMHADGYPPIMGQRLTDPGKQRTTTVYDVSRPGLLQQRHGYDENQTRSLIALTSRLPTIDRSSSSQRV